MSREKIEKLLVDENFTCKNLLVYWTFRLVINTQEFWEVDMSFYRVEKFWKLLKLAFRGLISCRELSNGDIKICFDKEKLFQQGPQILKELRQKAWDVEPEFLENLEAIQKIFSLSQAEKEFFAFVVLAKYIECFDELLDHLGSMTMSEFVTKVSFILDIPKEELFKILSSDSTLFKVGLLEIGKNGSSYISTKVDVLKELVDELFLSHKNPEEIFQNYLKEVRSKRLKKEDFFFIKELDMLISYLKSALRKNTRGVNILLYGQPGTGKTELAKMLAKEAGAKLYEISTIDKKGKPLSEKERFACYRLAQFLLKRGKKALILFDEVDDILDIDLRIFFGEIQSSKGDILSKVWINRLLVENEVPAIWIANSISNADPAYLRRFDIVLKMDYPPRTVRLKLLKNYFKKLPVSEEWLESIAEVKHLSPAIIAKAAKVVSVLKKKDLEKEAEFVIVSSLEALGLKPRIKRETGEKLPFWEKCLNTDWGVEKLLEALKRSQTGRLLFYGPPGTGKTELARKVAFSLNRELLLRRTSDIISPYVGETESNIAYMFKEAREEQAVLLLDEADSFLLSRKNAKYSWEISMVNELLTQMEAFEGIFICATNFADSLDEAVMRRFDLKMKFDYLTEEQALKFFTNLFGEEEVEKYRRELSKLLLTPGNFATVYRKLKFVGDEFSPKTFIKALKEEARFNTYCGGQRKLGFV